MGFHSLRPVLSLSRPYPGPIPWHISRPACRSNTLLNNFGNTETTYLDTNIGNDNNADKDNVIFYK